MKLQHQIEIAAPASRVFEYVSAHQHMPEWISTLQSSSSSDGQALHAGSEFTQEHVENGKRVEFSGKVQDFVPNERLGMELSNKDATVTIRYTLAGSGDSTRLEQNTDVELKSLMLRMVAGAFEGTVRARMEEDFRKLKTLAEQAS